MLLIWKEQKEETSGCRVVEASVRQKQPAIDITCLPFPGNSPRYVADVRINNQSNNQPCVKYDHRATCCQYEDVPSQTSRRRMAGSCKKVRFHILFQEY